MAISAQFTADFTQFTGAVDGAKASLQGLEGQAGTITPAMQKASEQLGQDLSKLAGQVKTVATDYVKAYAEEEQATQRLVTALKAQGLASTQTISDYARMAEQFQATTRFSDDAVTKSQALFTSIGKLGPAQMEPALKAAADLAAFMGTDLESAAMLMAKAFSTGGESLGRLKTLLGEAAPKGSDFTTILTALESKFGGQAAADMQTFNGNLARMNNMTDDAKESVGGFIAGGLTPLMKAFGELPPVVQASMGGIASMGKELVPLAGTLAQVTTALSMTGLLGSLTALVPFLLPAGAIIVGIGAVYLAFKNWDKIAAIVAGVYNAVKTYMVDKFNAMVEAIMTPIRAVVGAYQWMADKIVMHSIVPDMMEAIGSEFEDLGGVMVAPAKTATQQVTNAFLSMGAEMLNAIRIAQMWDDLAGRSGGILVGAFSGLTSTPSSRWGAASQLNSMMGGSGGVHVTINGSVLSNKDEIARVVQDALVSAHMTSGGRMPVGA